MAKLKSRIILRERTLLGEDVSLFDSENKEHIIPSGVFEMVASEIAHPHDEDELLYISTIRLWADPLKEPELTDTLHDTWLHSNAGATRSAYKAFEHLAGIYADMREEIVTSFVEIWNGKAADLIPEFFGKRGIDRIWLKRGLVDEE